MNHRATRDRIFQMAEKEFAGHVLLEEGQGRWHCGVPGTMMYSFRVIIAPYYVVLLGDLGDLVLNCSDADSLRWLRTASHVEYLLSKARHPDRTFCEDEPQAYLATMLAEHDDNETEEDAALRQTRVGALQDEFDAYEEDFGKELAWTRAWWHVMHESEAPDLTRWSQQMYWQAAALQWFVSALAGEKGTARTAATATAAAAGEERG